MTEATDALKAYRQRGCVSLKDRDLEASIFSQLQALEHTIGRVAPTPLRHRLSELIVDMRREVWAFDQANSPWG